MSLKALKEIFEKNKTGIVPITQLQEVSRSNSLIREVAHKYGYVPYNTKYSRKVSYYVHFTQKGREETWT